MSSRVAEVLRFERSLPAPPALVFAALTKAELIRRWMCPEGFRVEAAEAEAELGGRFRIVMLGPDRSRYAAAGEYREVRAPGLVELTWTWEPGHTLAGVETRLRVELFAQDGGTRLVMTHFGLPSDDERESHRAGWTGALAKLERMLEEDGRQWTA